MESKRIVGLFNTYTDYLASLEWQQKREAFLEFRPRCENCGNIATQVHHKNYENVGREKLRDLMAVCKKCHQKVHKK